VQIAGAGSWLTPKIKPGTTGSFTSTELVCASCHTKGRYKFAGTATHQNDTFSQWTSSAHHDRVGIPWNEIATSAYPLDLSKPTVAAPTACQKCHNGLATIDYMGPIDPATRRPTTKSYVWGGAFAVCITCHDPHADGAGHTKNVRTPVFMTNYTGVFVGAFMGNVFLDTQPLPSNAGNSSICIFCHQGRESGLDLYKAKLAPERVAFGNITGNFKNNHYLGTAAMLWGANAYELGGKSYTANFAHQQTNCVGCHMANPTVPVNVGGHTWRPNPASCNPCHSAITAATDLSLDPGAGFLTTSRATTDTTNYSGNSASIAIAQQIQDLQNYIIALLAANGVFYDDTVNPYFFNNAIPATIVNGTANPHRSATAFRQWTPPVYKAAFNLAIAAKANPSAPASTSYTTNGAGVKVPVTSITLVPNKSAAVHNYKYVIELLIDSYENLYNNSTPAQITAAQGLLPALPPPATLTATRPAGTRQAINYDAFVKPAPGVSPTATYGGVYNANQ
jgi:hypothetical protein